jgi:hypothetical protein
VAGLTVDPEIVEVVLVGNLKLGCVCLVMTLRALQLQIVCVHIVGEL